jgi:RNA polymerase-binding protein DksA
MANNNISGAARKLQAEKQAILLKLNKLRHELELPQEADDPEDSATELVEHEIVLGQIEHLENRLKLIESALEQIKQGTYGICDNCGQPIDPARLKVMPEATLCIQCQTRGEYAALRKNRSPGTQ